MTKNIKNIISAKFKRSFIDGLQHTWLFDEAPKEVKLHILQSITSETDIIVCSYFAPNHWFVITTDVITIEKNNTRQTFYFNDVVKVDCDLKKLAATKQLPFEVIDLYTPNGIVPLEVEKRTWGAWVEVLKLLCNFNI